MKFFDRSSKAIALSDMPPPSAPVETAKGAAVSVATAPKVSMQEIIDQYDILTVADQGDFMVVTPRESPTKPITLSDPNPLTEIGGSGYSNYGAVLREEYNPDLRDKAGWRKFDEMRRSDGQVAGTLQTVKTPVLAARWYMEPASDSDEDKAIAAFVWDNFTKYPSTSWPQLLTEILSFLDFGWYAFEKVYEPRFVNGDIKICLKKLGPRHPLDSFNFEWDYNGGPTGVNFFAPADGPDSVFIPISKLLIFTFRKEAGNMVGISVLRSAYKHWYFKDNLYKIDAIQKERHGIGIPVIKLPPNYSEADKVAADNLGRNLRTNEKAHVVLPPFWELTFAELSGNPVDCVHSIEHHDKQISKNIMASFLDREHGAGNVTEQSQLFAKGTRFIAEIIRDVFNKWLIPELVGFNYKVENFPELRVRRIGDTVDWRTLSFALRNLVGAGILVADDPLEDWIRDEMDLPKADPKTARTVLAPQAAQGGQNGPPIEGKPGSNDTGPPAPTTGGQQAPAVPVAGLPRQSAPSATPPRSGGVGDKSGG